MNKDCRNIQDNIVKPDSKHTLTENDNYYYGRKLINPDLSGGLDV